MFVSIWGILSSCKKSPYLEAVVNIVSGNNIDIYNSFSVIPDGVRNTEITTWFPLKWDYLLEILKAKRARHEYERTGFNGAG